MNDPEDRDTTESPRGGNAEGAPLTRTVAAVEATSGGTIGPYHLLDRIGDGGMGEVWLAEQKHPVRRRVAMKLIKAGMDTREVVARFESERQALALMDHPSIAKVFDGGSTPQGRPYFVMEYVTGIPITLYCDKHKLTTQERLELFIRVCEAVQHAHQKAIIHRDIKPSNILVGEVDGKPMPRIIDFGVAKATSQGLTPATMFTRVGAIIGTPEYMSPEQADSGGENVDTRTDVYSLGVVLYELLTGALPHDFQKLPFDEMLRRVREQDAPRPSTKLRTLGAKSETTAQNRSVDPPTLAREVRGDLDAITLKALEKDRSRRYATPSELAADIARYLNDEPVLARPQTTSYRAWKFIRRHQASVAASVLVALGLLSTTGWAMWQTHVARQQRARAERRFDDVRALAGSLLFELHDAIQNLPGATGARKLIVDRALQYLDSLAAEARGDERLQRELAAAYERVGDVQGGFRSANLGDINGSLASYRKAVAIRTAVAASDPNNLAAQRELIRAHGKLSDALIGAGYPAEGVEQIRELITIAERLSAGDPANFDNRRLLAAAYLDYAWKRTGSGDWQGRLADLRKSVSMLEALAQAQPNDKGVRRLLGIAYIRTGNLLSVYSQDRSQALGMHQKALELLRSMLGEDKENTDLQRIAAWELIYISDILSSMGDTGAALTKDQEALQILRSLSASDPKDVQFHIDMAGALGSLGGVYLKRGEAAAAISSLRSSLAELDRFGTADSHNADALSLTASDEFRLGKAYTLKASDPALSGAERASNSAEARSWYRRSLPNLIEAKKKGSLDAIPEDMIGEAQRALAHDQ